jgi:hypothetical protein
MAPNPKLHAAAVASKKKGGIHIKPSHQGLLHEDLGVKQGNKIPVASMQKAANSDNEALRKRAQFAINARKWHH